MTNEEIDLLARSEAREVLNPLRLEMASAVSRVTLRHAEVLRGIGLPVAALIGASMIGLVNIARRSG
ncbi:hypothetical protein K7W03_27640 [Sphingobium sp. PNB]|uniref:hypothetical protein n=1 Tax=Sphingobium sp. PNB TaxID=863934 RepID=UPI001CA40713|nr:hypothetical protein [Sphingobium sp. PNB]MCB4863341.1 hypothetical protein [Sphingobium sp. PNB]